MNRRNFLRASLGGIVALTAGILAPTALSATPKLTGIAHGPISVSLPADYAYTATFRVYIGREFGRIVEIRNE